MKIKVSFLFPMAGIVLVLGIGACSVTPDTIPDEILYVDIQPDTAISSAEYMEKREYIPGVECILSINAHDTNYYDLDLNDDGISDFRLSHHFYSFQNVILTPMHPCNPEYGFYSKISALHSGSRIIIDQYDRVPLFLCGSVTRNLASFDTIKCGNLCDTTAMLFHDLYRPCRDISSFTGLVILDEGGTHNGWVSTIIGDAALKITEYAINLTHDKDVIIGVH